MEGGAVTVVPGVGLAVFDGVALTAGAEGAGDSTRPPGDDGSGDDEAVPLTEASGEVCGFPSDPPQPAKRQASRIAINRCGFIVGESTRLREFEDAWSAGFLPPHHQDPFDRMLAAQALASDFTLASVDGIFELYGVKVLSRGRGE